MMLKKLRILVVGLLAISLSCPVPVAAGILSTESALGGAERERIMALLDRADVREQLQAYGVTATEVEARVAALTDAEAAELAAHMENRPAGGVIGAIVLVFLVLLLTDILGLTKVFPFTKPIDNR